MKVVDSFLRSIFFQMNLRTKLTLAFVVPMAAIIVLITYVHTTREWQKWQSLTEESAIRTGYLTLGSLKHAMVANDVAMIEDILGELEKQQGIEKVWIVDNNGLITDNDNQKKRAFQAEAGCIECHLYEAEIRPQAIYLPEIDEEILRIAIPINNEPVCQSCHLAESSHLGVLLIDNQIQGLQAHLREDRWINIAITGAMLIITLFVSYLMIQWLIVQRIRIIDETLSLYAAGDLSVRVPAIWRTTDEITRLADRFNSMAETLERYQKEQRDVAAVRQRAILDERERLSRDLHDGIVQVFGYLTTKLATIRLLLEQGRSEQINQQMDEIEKIITKENADVRAAIADLQSINLDGSTLVENLQAIVHRCEQLCTMKVSLMVDPGFETIRLTPETEFHLGRIVQESIANIRKHAQASETVISVKIIANHLILTVEDDGQGFNLWQKSNWKFPHFGLHSMSDRAEKIGATFRVSSEPGQGTIVTVKLKVGD